MHQLTHLACLFPFLRRYDLSYIEKLCAFSRCLAERKKYDAILRQLAHDMTLGIGEQIEDVL